MKELLNGLWFGFAAVMVFWNVFLCALSLLTHEWGWAAFQGVAAVILSVQFVNMPKSKR